MNMESAAADLEKQVKGSEVYVGGVKSARPGLLEIVRRSVPPSSPDYEVAMLELGFVLGVATMLAGMKDRAPVA